MGYYDDYLEHHGIKGQKWGVRRFENKDGSLTPAGRARYDKFKKSKELGDARDKAYSNFMKKGAELVKKNPKLKSEVGDEIDDDELLYQQVNDHYSTKSKDLADFNKLYDDYWDARTESRRFDSANKKEIAEGKKIADKIINSNKDTKTNSDTVKKLAIAGTAVAATTLAAYGLHKLNQKAIGGLRQEYKEQARSFDKRASRVFEKSKMSRESANALLNSAKKNNSVLNINEYGSFNSIADQYHNIGKQYAQRAHEAIDKAGQKDYSLKEKVNYLRRKR